MSEALAVRLDDLSWMAPVYALAPTTRPMWNKPEPDGNAIWQAVQQQVAAASAHLAAERDVIARMRMMVMAAVAALLAGIGAWVAFTLLYLATSSSDTNSATSTGTLIFGAAAVILALSHARFAASCNPQTGARWLISGLVGFIGFFFAGIPIILWGLYALVSRPKVWEPGRAPNKIDTALILAYRKRAAASKDLEGQIRSAEDRYRAEFARQLAVYEAERQAFDLQVGAMLAFEPTPIHPEPDLLAVGGSVAERAELVHHLVGAFHQVGTVWTFDFGNGASRKAFEVAAATSAATGMIDASDDGALEWHLDQLVRSAGGPKLLVNVLSDALATSGSDRTGASRGDIADSLERVSQVLADVGLPVTMVALHESIVALLSGSHTASTTAVVDDFGTATPPDAAPAPATLSARAVEALRVEFTDDERREFLREWTDIRRKLRSLVRAHQSAPEPDRPWAAETRLAFAGVSEHLAIDDLKLRRSLLLGLCRNLLRSQAAGTVSGLVIVGADLFDEATATELSSLAEAARVALVLVFGELTPTVRSLARGRRSLLVLGGLGSEAAEEISTMLGKGWVERQQSYQSNWSDAVNESRAITAGRSTSQTSGTSSSRSNSQNGWSTSESTSSSSTWGQNSSSTDTHGTTHSEGGSIGHVREYEELVRGGEVANIAPFTAVLRSGSRVEFVEFHGSVPVESNVVAAARALGPSTVGAPVAGT